MLTRKKDMNKALECYEKASILIPNDANVWFQKACVLSALKRYNEAIASFEAVLKIDPNNYKASNYREFLKNHLQIDEMKSENNDQKDESGEMETKTEETNQQNRFISNFFLIK